MSYSYSQLNEIISLQYAKKDNADDDNWFLEETIKMGKGYIKPSNYLKNIGNKILEDRNKKDNKIIDDALYIDI
jgi:hypothetical protein